jgi:hypothetical protein
MPVELGGAMSGSRIRPYVGPLIAMLVILALGVGTVYAAIPNPTNKKFYACFVKKTGEVRLINYPTVSTCQKGERLVSWNAKGPVGPQGATGPQGPQGPEGPQGPAGTSGSSDWTDIANKPDDLADGQIGWGEIKNKPAGFADGVDDEGITNVNLATFTHSFTVAEGKRGQGWATCLAGKVVGGGFAQLWWDVDIKSSAPDGTDAWRVAVVNNGPDERTVTVYAICMSVEPAGVLTTSKVKVAKKKGK